jgi:hypothetical protein
MKLVRSFTLILGVLVFSAIQTFPAIAFDIESETDLANVSFGSNYTLTQNIQVTMDWTPLNYSNGTFDGNGFAITGLNRPLFNLLGSTDLSETTLVKNLVIGTSLNPIVFSDPNPQGLLANFSQGVTVGLEKTTQIINVDVNGTINNTSVINDVGGIVGSVANTEIKDSSATGTVTGTSWATGGIAGYAVDSTITGSVSNVNVNGVDYVGGLIGHSLGTTITSSSTTGNVIATSSDVGGLVGKNEKNSTFEATVTKSFATGDVIGINNVGGLIGKNLESEITESFSTADEVSGNANVGGLIGWTTGNISNTYATGNVFAGTNAAGGLVGHAESINPIGVISNSYATGNVEAVAYEAGGLVGFSYFTIQNSFALGDVTTVGNSGGIAGGITGNYLPGTPGVDSAVLDNSYATGNVSGGSAGRVYGTAWQAVTENDILNGTTGSGTVNGLNLDPVEIPEILPILITGTGPSMWSQTTCRNAGLPFLTFFTPNFESTCSSGTITRPRRERDVREIMEIRTPQKIEKSLGFKSETPLPKPSLIAFIESIEKIDLTKVKALEIAPTANVKIVAKTGEALQISLKSESKEPVELWVKSPDGTWLLAGVITFDTDGKAILPPLQFKNAGDYTLVLNKPSVDSAKGSAPLNQTGSLLVAVS